MSLYICLQYTCVRYCFCFHAMPSSARSFELSVLVVGIRMYSFKNTSYDESNDLQSLHEFTDAASTVLAYTVM